MPYPTIYDKDGAVVFDWGGGVTIEASNLLNRGGLRCELLVKDGALERSLVGFANLALDNLRERREFVQSLSSRDGKIPDWDARILLVADVLRQRLTEQKAQPYEAGVTALVDFLAKKWDAGTPVVQGLLSQGDVAFLFGQVGHGKTLVAAECAVCVATGRPLFGAFPTFQGTVLLVQEDTHPAQEQKYLAMLVDAYGIEDAPLFVWERQFLRLDDDAKAEVFMREVEELRPTLVILDAFLDLHSGDGMLGRELRPVLDRIVVLPQLVPCAVLVLDHPKKENTQKTKTAPDPIDALYGGRMKSALADTMIFTKRISEMPARFALSIVKCRDVPRAPFTVTFTAEDGFVLDESPIGLTPAANKILQWGRTLAEGTPFTRMNAEASTDLATRTVKGALGELLFNRLIEQDGKSGRAYLYRFVSGMSTRAVREDKNARGPQRPLSDMAPGGGHQDSGGVD